jgi:hypothetical protein
VNMPMFMFSLKENYYVLSTNYFYTLW